MDINKKSSSASSRSTDGSSRRMREVACPTCTVHLQVQVPTSGSETIECGVCQQPFLVSARWIPSSRRLYIDPQRKRFCCCQGCCFGHSLSWWGPLLLCIWWWSNLVQSYSEVRKRRIKKSVSVCLPCLTFSLFLSELFLVYIADILLRVPCDMV